jgi:RNA polymerase sigma factor (sigma-70 family)
MGSGAIRPAAPNGEPMGRELVQQAVAGDHDAFVSLARPAYDRLYHLASLILRDEELASDAAQEALTSAWLHIRAVRDPDRFDAWLNRLTVHAAYGEARRRRGRLVEIGIAQVDVPDGWDALGAVDDHDQLERGFRRLNPQQRAVLVVHHYLQLSDAEAAAVLGIPVGTVKSRLNRATVALRAAIEADNRIPAVPTKVPA